MTTPVLFSKTTVSNVLQPTYCYTSDGLTITTDSTSVPRQLGATNGGFVTPINNSGCKAYWEVKCNSGPGVGPNTQYMTFGISSVAHNATVGSAFVGGDVSGFSAGFCPDQARHYFNNASFTAGVCSRLAQDGDVYGIAVDAVNAKIYVRLVTAGDAWNNGVGSANPSTNTGGLSVGNVDWWVPAIAPSNNAGNGSYTFNFGATPFSGTVPSGFVSYATWAGNYLDGDYIGYGSGNGPSLSTTTYAGDTITPPASLVKAIAAVTGGGSSSFNGAINTVNQITPGTGKYFWRVKNLTAGTPTNQVSGVTQVNGTTVGGDVNTFGTQMSNGIFVANGGQSFTPNASAALANDIYEFAWDSVNGRYWSRNFTRGDGWIGLNTGTGNPATNTGGIPIVTYAANYPAGPYFVAIYQTGNGASDIAQALIGDTTNMPSGFSLPPGWTPPAAPSTTVYVGSAGMQMWT